jgi:hypothetical protein
MKSIRPWTDLTKISPQAKATKAAKLSAFSRNAWVCRDFRGGIKRPVVIAGPYWMLAQTVPKPDPNAPL